MRLGRFALAAVLLSGLVGGAMSSSLIPTGAGVYLKAHNEVEAVRWRHRHRGYFWGGREDREDADIRASSLSRESHSTIPEVVPPDIGGRYHRGRFWGGRREVNRDETSGIALNLSGANRFSPSEVVRPNPRRRGGWVDPPPAQ
jgi:hypothetical protein